MNGIVFAYQSRVKTVSCLILSFAVSFAGHPAWEKIFMDFFETREKYRRREISIYSRWIARLFFLGLALWLGWQWGSLEQRQIQADRDLVLYERAQRIELLNRDVERLNHDLRELKAEKEALELTQSFGDSKLTRLIKGQIARGTTIEQIHQRLQALGTPVNCRNVENKTVAVATELYSGVESNITFFDGGLGLHVEGKPVAQGTKNNPWFDTTKPLSVRFIYLGSQKVVKGVLPLKTVIPAEDWLLAVEITPDDLRGYVRVNIENCTLR